MKINEHSFPNLEAVKLICSSFSFPGQLEGYNRHSWNFVKRMTNKQRILMIVLAL